MHQTRSSGADAQFSIPSPIPNNLFILALWPPLIISDILNAHTSRNLFQKHPQHHNLHPSHLIPLQLKNPLIQRMRPIRHTRKRNPRPTIRRKHTPTLAGIFKSSITALYPTLLLPPLIVSKPVGYNRALG